VFSPSRLRRLSRQAGPPGLCCARRATPAKLRRATFRVSPHPGDNPLTGTAALWNRARGARWGSGASRFHHTLRRLSESLACHTDFQRKGVASRGSSASQNGGGGICFSGRSAAPILPSCAKPLDRASFRQEIRAALGTLRGRLRLRWKRPALRSLSLSEGIGRFGGRCVFVPFPGPLVAALFLLGPTSHDGFVSRNQCDRVHSPSPV